jgi:hypothetical protein
MSCCQYQDCTKEAMSGLIVCEKHLEELVDSVKDDPLFTKQIVGFQDSNYDEQK